MPIAGWDLAVVGLYFAMVAAIGWLVARRTSTADDLFVAGRSLGFGAIGFSLFASNISSTTLIGLTGQAYSTGISVANYEWMAALLFVLMAVVVMPIFLGNRISTVPQYLELRYGVAARRYFSGFTILTTMAVDTAGGLYAGALVLKTFYPELELWVSCVTLALVAGVYTAAGGLKAVVYTDVLQAVVLILGSTLLAGHVLAVFDFSWAQIQGGLPAGHLSLIRPLDDPALPWLGTLIGVPVIGFYFWATNQYIVQRVLGARDLSQARWGAILAAFLKITPLFIMVLPGAAARLLYPDIGNADRVFARLVVDQLSVGVTGLVLAGLTAAIMSSVDSTLNAASSLIVNDFFAPSFGKSWSPQVLGRAGRWVTLLLMAVAAAWAPMIANFSGLFAYLQSMLAYTVPPVVAVYFFGMLWSRPSEKACLITLLVGHAVGLAVLTAKRLGSGPPWHFTIVAGVLFAFSTFVLALVTCLGPRQVATQEAITRAPQRAGVVWVRSMAAPTESLALWQDYRLHGALVTVLIAAIVVSLW